MNSSTDKPSAKPRGAHVVERVRDNLRALSPQARQDALFIAVKQDLRELSSEIMDLFRHEKDGEVRSHCAWALGRLRYRGAFEDLIQGLQSKDRRVRTWSAWALGEMGTDETMRPLIEAREKETVAEVKRAIGGALKKLRLESTRVPVRQVLKKLQPPATRDQHIAVIVDKLQSLEWPKDADEITALREQILHKDPEYFKAYMDWVKRKPALEEALLDKRKVY